MWRLVRVLLAALLALVVTAPPAAAEPHERRLAAQLGQLWTAAIETPAAEGPFGGEAGAECVVLPDGTLAPFVQPGDPDTVCRVAEGTPVFVVLWSSECSTAEVGTVWEAKNAGQARQCARRVDAGITGVSATLQRVGGASAPVPLPSFEVETQVLRLDLPEDNVFGVPPQETVSVAHGWVTRLEPLARGTWQIVITGTGDYPAPGPVFPFTTTTTIVVG